MASSLLSSLVKQAKACGKVVGEPASVLPLLDAYMDKLAGLPRHDPDWDGHDVFHPSEVSWDFCPRLQQIRRFRRDLVEKKAPAKAGLQRVFGLGSAIHDMYQNRVLGPMGVLWGEWENTRTGDKHFGFMPDQELRVNPWRYVEPKTLNEEHNLGGHCDGIVFFPNRPPAILEMKSINSYGFSRLDGPLGYHAKQLQLYLHSDFPGLPSLRDFLRTKHGARQIDWGVVLYHEKNQSLEKDFWVPKDRDVVMPLFAQVKAAMGGLATKELSPRIPSCSSSQDKTASSCVACSACFSVGDGGIGYTQLMTIK